MARRGHRLRRAHSHRPGLRSAGPRPTRKAVETLCSAAKSTGGHPRLVYTSGVWVLGSTAAPADERATLSPAAHSAWRVAHERLRARRHRADARRGAPRASSTAARAASSAICCATASTGWSASSATGATAGRRSTTVTLPISTCGWRPRQTSRAPITPPTKPTNRVLDIVEALSRNTTHKPDVRLVPLDEARAKLGTYRRRARDGPGRAQPSGARPGMDAKPAVDWRQRAATAGRVAEWAEGLTSCLVPVCLARRAVPVPSVPAVPDQCRRVGAECRRAGDDTR